MRLSAAAQPKLPAAGPERAIRDFYAWYVQAVVADGGPLGKRRAELSRYATTRLLRKIDKMSKGPDGLDGDYFLDAQDFDREWGRNMTVSHVAINGSHATADVRLKGSAAGAKNLHVTLVEGQGTWKVDHVSGR